MKSTNTLTPHEQRIRLLLLSSHTSSKIAKMLKVSRCAISNASKRMYVKLGVSNRYDLMAKEIQRCYAELALAKKEL